jgi:hypothetical protein
MKSETNLQKDIDILLSEKNELALRLKALNKELEDEREKTNKLKDHKVL